MHHSISKKDALSAAMKLCSKEERCASDVRKKLEDWGLHHAEMDEVIDHLIANKYIDEKRYACSFANDRYRFNKWGRLKIRQAMHLKQIDPVSAEQALAEIDETDYLLVFREEMEKKMRSIHEGTEVEKKAKLYRFGASRGFENDLIYKLLDEYFK